MQNSPDNELERTLAGFYYSLMRGLDISVARGRAAFDAWNRLALPHSAGRPASPADPEAYLRGFIENLASSGFTQVCRRWESRFDRFGVPFPSTDVRRFVADAIYLQHHSPHAHHDFFCICPTFKPGSVMDFQISHPFAADFWTVCLTEAGVGFIETRSAEIDFLPAGSVVLIPPGFRGDVGRAKNSELWQCLYLGFRPRPTWLAFLASSFSYEIPMVLRPDSPSELTLVRQVLNELSLIKSERGDIDDRLAFNLIENLVIRIHRLRDRSGASDVSGFYLKSTDPRIGAAVELVLTHCEEPLSLQNIAEHANLSTSRLAALFKSHYGTSLIQWRDGIRLTRARDLIATTNLQISEIARQVGWQDQLYFSKRFKRKFGDSPTSYRKHIQRSVD